MISNESSDTSSIKHMVYGATAQGLRYTNEHDQPVEFMLLLQGHYDLLLADFNRMHVPLGHYEWQVTPWAKEGVHDVSELDSLSFFARTDCLVHLWRE